MKSALLHRILAVTALALLAGCAQDLETISTVQPNKTKKADLVGREWYLRTTVVDTQFTSASSFPGEMGSLVRGVFDIQESTLYFYRTYEFMLGSEGYAQKSDVDIPLLDKNGKPVLHAVPEDFQKISCAPGGNNAECGAGARCADAGSPQLPGEEDYHGLCIRAAQKFIYKGAPLMAFPISSHFDVRCKYNAATGECTNEVVEDGSTRKWYDREYMRVSWGLNQLVSYDADVLAGDGATVIYEGDNAPEGEEFVSSFDGGKKETGRDPDGQHWFSYIHREVVNVPTTWLDGYGEIPICFFYPWYAGGVYDCSSEELKVRTFFLEVPQFKSDPERQYVARDQDDVEFEKFGFFRTERPVYDAQFGTTFDNAVRRAQRHRIWDRYVKCYVDPTGKDTSCAAGPGKLWKGEFDYSKMTPVPIVYYLNEEHPRELVQPSIDIAKGWSKPFEDVVEFHKGEKPAHPMFILCENSDAAAEAAKAAGHVTAEHSGTALGKQFCRDMDQPHRFGDLRYSTMHAVVQPIQVGLYGYGPSAADPLTGEILAGYAHSYVSAMKSGAEAALTAIELQAGIKDFNDVKRATEKEFKMKARSLKQYDQKGPKSLAEARDEVGAMLDASVRSRLQQGLEKVDNGGGWAQSRMAMLQKNPQLDMLLVSGDDGQAVPALFNDPRMKAGQPGQVDPSSLQQMSLASWAHIAGYRARQKKLDELAEQTLHFSDFADNALVGLAEEYGRQFDAALCKGYATASVPTLYNNFNDIATASQTCTAPGEFESQGQGKGRLCVSVGGKNMWASCSAKDLMQSLRLALNGANGYNPNNEQWHRLPSPLYADTMDPILRNTQEVGRAIVDDMRAKLKVELWQRIYQGTQEHEVGHTLGLRHNFEASTDALNFHEEFWQHKVDAKGEINALQPDTVEQARSHIRQYQLASVMDYTSKFNGRFSGLGFYDKAAIKFAYGDIVEAFNQFKPADLQKDPDAAGDLAPMADYLASPEDDQPSAKMVQFHGNTDMLKLTRRLHYSTLPKYFGKAENMYDRKNVSWREFKGDRCETDSQCGTGKACRAFGGDKYCSTAELVEVPYRFCSDEFNGQTPTCATFDEGVDAYEIARNALDDYEQYWYFWGYSRDSEMFHVNNYYGRVMRQFYTATRQMQFWVVDYATYQKGSWWKQRYGVDFDKDINGGLAGGLATLGSFNTMTSVLGRPSTGYFVFNNLRSRFEPYNQLEGETGDPHWFDETNGFRPLYGGYGGGYLYRPLSAGQFYDRQAAFIMLSDPTMPRFLGINESEDLRRYLVSYHTVFPRQLTDLYAGWSVEDAKHFGWYVLQGETDEQDYILRRNFAGIQAEQVPKSCADYGPETPKEQKVGCLKYVVFPDARPTFPSSRFRMPLLASLYGMALLQQSGDFTYMDLSRVFLAGNKAQVELDGALDVAKFTDPLSGKTYVAPKTTDAMLNPGYLAVKAAQKELDKIPNLQFLQDNYLFSEYQFRVSLLDLQRSMHETYDP